MSDSNCTVKFCQKCQSDTEHYKDGRCKACCKANNAAWRLANAERHKANIAAWSSANPEKKRASAKIYAAKNPGKLKARKASYQSANFEKCRAWTKDWIKANPDATRIYNHNRQAKKRANGGKLSNGLSAKLFTLQRGKCACCKLPLGSNYHLDHIVPLSLGGSNTDDNIQLLRSKCNLQKHATHPVDFMQSRGFLL